MNHIEVFTTNSSGLANVTRLSGEEWHSWVANVFDFQEAESHFRFVIPESVSAFDFAEPILNKFAQRSIDACPELVLRQGRKQWRAELASGGTDQFIVFKQEEFEEGGETYQLDIDVPSDVILSRKSIADYWWVSQGDIPMANVPEGYLLDLGPAWMEFYGADSSDYEIVRPKPSNAAEVVYAWLSESPALVLFVYRYATCGWVDAELKEKYEESVDETLGYCFGISVALDSHEIMQILELVRDSDSPIAAVLAQIEAPISTIARKILSSLRNANESESALPVLEVT